ncbi:D-alanyl-D-alanine carboxypeptidase / D-alanyl-D-alanine-endopeptidase (penicillin-binding protein 4) [Onishia taeanensis]|uniref:D-alanyl-D-alanine carboxypeptidase / D-alanyl-D-alanine-endopeptidase (Penicillin-binding protein 4) n=1 Tax=Onishia taeanensis TaxID=284577 RepID=A0A1G7SS64_9GAMM|nr:D-alanyl-D-alanine carboxypeptidase/D-alanyl-D-alanine-endopeptidase [Halomonas taeanensis]SDG25853.1 D-alanyl-D-alanine carboxypeptidase / D-alanyl-D-alanine-endopeptidase (penicillin-binding protein 4) [Halomonas taeanensis]
MPSLSLRLLLVVLLCCVLGAPVASAAGFERLSALEDQGFLIGAEARLLDSGEVLGEITPDLELSPASVSKLYMAAAALDRWGPQHRFTTRLVTPGTLSSDGVVSGDLVFEGGGDPALVSEDLWRLVQQLRQQGVTRVDGALEINQWRYGPVQCITTDRCEARRHGTNAYSALLSAAGVDYGSWCLVVRPGPALGEPARVASCSSGELLTRLDNQVQTARADGRTRLEAERLTDAQGDRMVLEGTIAMGDGPRYVYRASSDPAEQTASTLASLLEQAGIAVTGGVRVVSSAPPAAATELASVQGKPLQELLQRTLNYSNNFMADVLALDLVGSPRATLPQAGDAVEAFALAIPGHGPLTLESGSGLTTGNRTTARGVTALLERMYQRPALFPSFIAGLQSPTNGAMRFLRRGSDTFQENVMLKTGTLNQPFSVRATGGYFRTQSGRWGVFSVLVNGTASTPYLAWRQVLEPLAGDLESMILSH